VRQKASQDKANESSQSIKTANMSPEKEALYKSLVQVKDEEIQILKNENSKKDNELETLAFALKESEHQTSALIEQQT
jgi:ssRNA-specific RNase YbeY (16S rRNA maturation enzyme)